MLLEFCLEWREWGRLVIHEAGGDGREQIIIHMLAHSFEYLQCGQYSVKFM